MSEVRSIEYTETIPADGERKPPSSLKIEDASKMTTPSPPRSADDSYSSPSSPTRSITTRRHSNLPSQDAHTSQTQGYSKALPTPSHISLSRDVAPHNEIDVTGISNQLSTSDLFSASSRQGSPNDMMHENTQPDAVPKNNTEQPLATTDRHPAERSDPLRELQSKDWEEMEIRYEQEMEAATQHEQTIMEEIDWVLKMMKESTVASSRTESERATKRLRTRIAYVQQSEEALAEKRAHYKGVVDAFQNAMTLLGGI